MTADETTTNMTLEMASAAAPSDDPTTASNDLCCHNTTNNYLSDLKKEIGGRAGPNPTRYGDWENKGRCVDF